MHFVLQKTNEGKLLFSEYYTKHLMILQPLSYSQKSLMSLMFEIRTHRKPCCYGNSVQAT